MGSMAPLKEKVVAALYDQNVNVYKPTAPKDSAKDREYRFISTVHLRTTIQVSNRSQIHANSIDTTSLHTLRAELT